MFEVVLHQPEIPPNTGNILRLCANTGCRLHLIEPLGFSLAAPALRRAGLDYDDIASVTRHAGWTDFRAAMSGRRLFALSTRGQQRHDRIAYLPGDIFVFGSETRGLPDEVLAEFASEARLRLPMLPTSRSLNLANAVAVVIFEAWRQQDFAGGL